MKISWQTKDSQLVSEWAESEGTGPYRPAWMQSSYPCEASAQRSSPNPQTFLSPFGKIAPVRHAEGQRPDYGAGTAF